MKSNSKENIILSVIKFAPSVFLVLLVVSATAYISNQHTYNLAKEQANLKKEYLDSYKYRLKTNIETVNRYIQDTFKNSKKHLKKDLQSKINNVYYIALNIYEKNKNTLSKKQIISLIKDAVEPIRFADGNGYFSIHTMDGINVLHPIFKDLERTSVLNRKDIDGTYPVKKAIELAKTKGEGFFTWHYFKPGDKSKHFKKFGITKNFEPYNLVITTAIFEDDLQTQIKTGILEHLKIIKYENDGYIFVANTKGEILLTKPHRPHANPDNTRFQEELKKLISSNKKDTFINYTFYDFEQEYSKLSYLLKVDNLDWIVGTGFNLDKINTLVKKRQDELNEKHSKYIYTLLISAIIVIIILLIISSFISKYLRKSFYLYKEEIIKKESQIADNYKQTVNSLVDLIEQRDYYTAGHSQRVANYAIMIAKAMEFKPEKISILREIGLLHDIGKVAIPDSILLKPSRLTKQEFEIIKSHSTIGYNVISKIPIFKEFSHIILSHHERYDGSGYPQGLKGDEIPALATVLSIADSFDAMTSTRVYNKTKTVKEALSELKSDSGVLYDEKILNIALEVLKDVDTSKNLKSTQLPKTPLEKERFAYFFKDNLTDTLNEQYFELVLKQDLSHCKCLNLILIHNFSAYNGKFGWEKGNELIQKIVKQIKNSYTYDEIYRFRGTNFILLNKTHVDMDMDILNKSFKDANISFELAHFDMENFKDFKEFMKSFKNHEV